MTATQPKPSLTREYWTHNVGEPTGPVAQFRMSQLVDYDMRLTDPARIVYRFLIGWYMRSNGDALASVRHIVATMRTRAPDGARHLSRSAVQRAIILLIETGWLVRRFTGKGRSGSRYVPVLNVLELAAQGNLPSVKVDSVPLYRDTNEDSEASHSTGTEVSHSTGTQGDVASHMLGQRPSYINPSTDGVTCKEDNECAAPSAPPSSGLVAADAGTAQGKEKKPFEQLYHQYGVRAEIGAARRAYDDIAPDADLHAKMMESARAWREAAGEGIERMHLRRWITEQRYLEDPKGERKPKERKAKTGAQKASANPVSRVGEIIEADVSKDVYGSKLVLKFGFPGEATTDHAFYINHCDVKVQSKGNDELLRLCYVMNINTPEDADELLFRPLLVTSKPDGTFEYDFVPANHNLAEAA